ncbi:MAG: N-acetylglutaminylglutamine amidotransferase [Rhodocyclaceae bacterium]|nr:N-acetylglutaminylglutamine amidotransferase [Rhodocyclaceae bacterium]
MCGICGELRFDQTSPDLTALARMMAAMERRGPDHGGSYSEGPLAFGHRRLSIIDLSEASDQPLHDPDLGLVLVFNGTIYNYPELREELICLGYHFFSHGDTEVILKAYHAWGADSVARLNGMFAFALWDLHRHELFLARDRTGIKPLYLARDNQRLRFASNTQALLAGGGVDTALDPAALHHHFSLHTVVPAPDTILCGVKKLPPAHWMRIARDGATTCERYWMLEARRPTEAVPEEEWVARVKQQLFAAVERQHRVADVPVGVLLSGGLDSSLLVGILAQLGASLDTFTIGFEDDAREAGNEFFYSDIIARHFGTRHRRHLMTNAQVLARIPEAVANMAEPMVSQDVTSFYLLGEQVAKEMKAVLSGQGADEVFGGYFWYPLMDAEAGSPLERFRKHYFDRPHDEFAQMLEPTFLSDDVTSALVAQELSKPGADSFLDQVLRFDSTTLIVDDPVKRVDNMTMAWGLEARVPFLDHKLIETAMQVPPALRLAQGGKGILKTIARQLIPAEVIDRPKGYFPMPALKFLSGPFLDWVREILMSDACRHRGLYRHTYVERLLAEPDRHFTPIKGSKLWHLALLEFWLQTHVDGR